MKTFTHANRARAASALALAAICATVIASDCEVTSVGLSPITELGDGLYLELFEGGLYPGGLNTPPPAHANEGLQRAHSAVVPRTLDGTPSPTGKYVLLSIGMSNTTQEFCSHNGAVPCDPWTFMGQAALHPGVETEHLVIANGAKGGQAATAWDDPTDFNYNRVRDTVLTPMGLSEAQVQVLWVKQANPGPTVSLPNAAADAYALEASLGDIVRAAKVRYPNLQMVFFSSRIYAGYASTPLNPEPYAYETAFSVKWLIEAQINQMNGGGEDPIAGDLDYATTPWLGWGAYLWADGLTGRSDGLVWRCEDFQSDGTHPAQGAEEKVGTLLLQNFSTSLFSRPWFMKRPCERTDFNNDGDVGVGDLLFLLSKWGECPPLILCLADVNNSGAVDVEDLLFLLGRWGACG